MLTAAALANGQWKNLTRSHTESTLLKNLSLLITPARQTEVTNSVKIRTHVEYANSVWCPFKIGDIKEIEKIQKRATKLVIKLKNKP